MDLETEGTMADQGVSTAPNAGPIILRVAIGTLVAVGFVVFIGGARGLAVIADMLGRSHLHAPNLRLIAQAPLAIQIHLATVGAALILATGQMIGPKGRTAHRVLGWTLAGLLLITAVTSLFIRNPQGGYLNPFQLFSAWTLISVPWAVWAARRHNVRRHAAIMTGLYFGGMVLSGALTFLPGRLMWRVFFG
jgi:uncharacterized membrane protein